MKEKTKLKIGVFSKMMQLTVKTLRHYEHKGLLLPSEVDKWTGYRYYSIEQMQRLNTIRHLQRLGFTLDEIKELYEEDEQSPSIEQLKEKIEETEHQIKMLTERRSQLHQMVNTQKRIKTMEKFSIESLPEIIVASHRTTILGYSALGTLCVETIGPEMQRLGCKCSYPGYCFTIDHNKEYNASNIDIEYCEQVEEMTTESEIIKFKRLEAVPKALCMKHIGPYERFHESFTEAFAYMEEHGYKIADQIRTSYIDGAWNREDPEQWLSLIQIPIK